MKTEKAGSDLQLAAKKLLELISKQFLLRYTVRQLPCDDGPVYQVEIYQRSRISDTVFAWHYTGLDGKTYRPLPQTVIGGPPNFHTHYINEEGFIERCVSWVNRQPEWLVPEQKVYVNGLLEIDSNSRLLDLDDGGELRNQLVTCWLFARSAYASGFEKSQKSKRELAKHGFSLETQAEERVFLGEAIQFLNALLLS